MQLYRIRPLEWVECNAGDVCGFADKRLMTSVGINQNSGACSVMITHPMLSYYSPCDSIEDGKQLAEQHWRERLESVLERVENKS